MEELWSSAVMYCSLKKDLSSYAQIRITLDENIDKEKMQRALDSAISRYPYFKVRLLRVEERYCLEDNDLPFLLYDDAESPTLARDENNGYLIRVCASGRLLNICFCHAIADGRGISPLIKTLLHFYHLYKYNANPQMPDLRLPGDTISPEEYTDPFTRMDFSGVKLPEEKPSQRKVFTLPNHVDALGRSFIYTFCADGDRLMSFVKSSDGTPNALTAVLLAKALAHLFPEQTDNITIGIAVDFRPALGANLSHFSNVGVIHVNYSKRLAAMELSLQETCVRGDIILQSDHEYLLPSFARSNAFFSYIHSLKTLEEKKKLSSYGVLAGSASFTACVSYAGKQDYGAVNAHIDGIDIATQSFVPSATVEIFSFGSSFYFTFIQNFDDDKYMEAFYKEFVGTGIPCSEYKKQIVENVPFDELP